jgi:hypothetical protein
MHSNRGGIVGGLILILLGLGFLVQQAFPDYFSGWLFLVGLALIFLVAYIATRQYGYLIPGCILMGLGIPLAVVQIQTSQMGWYVSSLSLDEGGLVVLGLGLGFVAIYVICWSRVAGQVAGGRSSRAASSPWRAWLSSRRMSSGWTASACGGQSSLSSSVAGSSSIVSSGGPDSSAGQRLLSKCSQTVAAFAVCLDMMYRSPRPQIKEVIARG